MNAIDILSEHLRLLLSLYGTEAHGAGYLRGLIDARTASGTLSVSEGFASTMQPLTLDGYRYSAVRVFGEASAAVVYLDSLIAQYGGSAAVTQPELTVAYRLGQHVAGHTDIPSILENPDATPPL